MMKFPKQTRYISTLYVWVPSASALFDMLRYDSCFPASEWEAGKIERLADHDAKAHDHLLRLTRCSLSGDGATEGRWQSFGCKVLAERSANDSPLTDNEVAHLAVLKGVHGLKLEAKQS